MSIAPTMLCASYNIVLELCCEPRAISCYYFAFGSGAKYCRQKVCISSIHVSQNHATNLQILCVCGSVLLWRKCNTSYMYVFIVLWITSRFHVLVQIRRREWACTHSDLQWTVPGVSLMCTIALWLLLRCDTVPLSVIVITTSSCGQV